MIARWIDLCARNRFLVFTGTLLLVLAGIWAERQMPMDALPDISDAQVIIHTAWYEPPNVIEDQVTYPIVTALLAAPSVKAVRAQTMFGDSYVLVLEGVAALGSQCLESARRRVVIKLGEFGDYGLLLVG
jgi:copper/silver efflux system protein